VVRAEMFAHHHIQREALSVRERMGNILASLERGGFVEFGRLFKPEEGRMGVTVTFMAILELVREGLIDIVQSEPYAPLHVRPGKPALRVVGEQEAQSRSAELDEGAEPVVEDDAAAFADEAETPDSQENADD
jgi:chromatin segregation and condensation protein Rec8/ScpA/Scc1 (kleisin family)